MKKILIPVVVLALVVVGAYFALTPKSEKILGKMKSQFESIDKARFLSDPAYRIQLEGEQNSLTLDLAHAYIEEGNAELAISAIEGLIKENQQLVEESDALGVRHHSSTYRYAAALYRVLARAYDLKKDSDSAQKAHKKSETLERQAQSLQKGEDIEKKKASAKLLE